MSKSLFSIPVVLLLAAQISYAQPSMREWLEAAKTAYDTSDYYNAFRYYEAALKYKPSSADSIDILWMYAESARNFDAYLYAKRGYKQILNSNENVLKNQYPYSLSSFYLGKMYQTLSLYDSAAMSYRFFIDNIAKPGSREAAMLEEAQKGLSDCTFANAEISKGIDLTVLSLDSTLNGVNSIYSDFGATYWNDTLYYTSFKFINKKDKNYLKQKRHYNKVLTASQGVAGMALPDSINVDGDHVAHTAFNGDGTRMYYTVCEYVDKGSAEVRCDLYMRERDGQGSWKNPKRLTVNVANATNTQPSVGFVERIGQEVLFFTSDRAGGQGGLDIWCGNINSDGDVATAAAVQEVNTLGNDVTPFFLNLTQTLYFSSDNREGMGGYDVYESSPAGSTWTFPKHVRFPVSTSYDDLYLSLTGDGSKGYLSSNRLGAAQIDRDKEACCLDIFTFDMKVDLIVTTCNQMTQQPLNGATVELYEITPNGDQLIGKPQTNANGNDFNFPLVVGKKYRIKAMYEGFRTEMDSVDVNYVEFVDRRLVNKPICLGPPIELQVNTFKQFNGNNLNGATVNLYEVTPSGESLLEGNTNQNGHNFTFRVERSKRYNIKASRPYYFSKNISLDLTQPQYEDSILVVRNIYFGQEHEIVVIDSATNIVIANTTLIRQDPSDNTAGGLLRRTNPDGSTFVYDTQAFDMDRSYSFTAASPGYDAKTMEWAFNDSRQVVNEGHFVDTIPLNFRIEDVSLYFDHDRPDGGSRRPVTSSKYDETINVYYGRKAEFIRALFGTGKLTEQDSVERERYISFFDREMGQEFDRLKVIAGA
ncbi:MAG: tetratricopeptide repeat protein [Saprospiraceae bacterium]|nr:tetratricopeptide repeat protein [Saprospiraceae bacterium]